MDVRIEKKGTVGVVTLTGPLSALSVDSFRDQFLQWWDAAPEIRNVVMDLANVEFMDSSGLGALIALLKRVADRGGDLRLCGIQKKVRLVFEITRAHRVFEILDTQDGAVASFYGMDQARPCDGRKM
ncbi:MAG: STAS domain-containing protein [bacterium]